MAGDWIKIEHVTPDKPEVHRIALDLNVDPDTVVGKLIRIWVWADQQTIIGNAPSVTEALLDRITMSPGFARAMKKVGWLVIKNNIATFPNFDRHNGKTAKTRALSSRRVEKFRNALSVTNSLPEKRREENNTPLPPKGGNEWESDPDFQQFWNAYPKKYDPESAWRVWQSLKLDQKMITDIIAAVLSFKRSDKWQEKNGQYIPRPAKFLKERQWQSPPLRIVDGETVVRDIEREMIERRKANNQ